MVTIKTAIKQVLDKGGSLISKKDNVYKFKYKGSYIILKTRGKDFTIGVNSTGKVSSVLSREADIFDSVIKAINFIKKTSR